MLWLHAGDGNETAQVCTVQWSQLNLQQTLKYRVGVQVEQRYDVVGIDEDFFE